MSIPQVHPIFTFFKTSSKAALVIIFSLSFLLGAKAFAQLSMTTPFSGLSSPAAVASDSTGDIYIADNGGNVVYREDPAIGQTVIAGTGTAGSGTNQLDAPSGVALDSSGNIYIADSGNNRIEVVSAGTMSTFATGFAQPSGIAVDPTNTYLYVADTNNNVVKRITLASPSTIVTVAGGGTSSCPGDGGSATSACLSYPVGVTVDSSGNLYIADSQDYRVRKVTASTGIISTVAGNGSAPPTSGSIYVAGVLIDPFTSDLYIATGFQLYEIPHGGSFTFVACNGSAGHVDAVLANCEMDGNDTQGMTFDLNGNFFIADSANGDVREIGGLSGPGTTCSSSATLTLSRVTGTSNAVNPSGPLTSGGGDASLYVEKDHTGSTNTGFMLWSGFPACVVPSGGLTLTINDLDLETWESDGLGLANSTIAVYSAPWASPIVSFGGFAAGDSGPFTVVIPAGTFLNTVYVRNQVVACGRVTSPACGASSTVSYLHIH